VHALWVFHPVQDLARSTAHGRGSSTRERSKHVEKCLRFAREPRIRAPRENFKSKVLASAFWHGWGSPKTVTHRADGTPCADSYRFFRCGICGSFSTSDVN